MFPENLRVDNTSTLIARKEYIRPSGFIASIEFRNSSQSNVYIQGFMLNLKAKFHPRYTRTHK